MQVKLRVGLLVVSMGAVAALAVGSGAASQTPPPFALGNAGLLRLHLGASDYFRFEPTDTDEPILTQAIETVRQCEVEPEGSPAPQLVTLEPTPANAAVGIAADGIGVRGRGPGQNCGQVDGSEALTLRLGPDPALAGLKVDKAELDVEGKFSVVIVADMYLGNELVGTDELDTGAASDSGPDSADGDNFRWAVDADLPFDRIVLRVKSPTQGGAFSLEGGADGTAAGDIDPDSSDSVFHLVELDGVLDCGDEVTEGAAGEPIADLARNANSDNSDCELIPYALRTSVEGDDQLVELLKDLSGQPGANFTMRIAWDPEPAQLDIPVTEIDFADGDGLRPVDLCAGTTAAPQLPASGAPWCLARQELVLVGGGEMRIIEDYFGSGDPTWTRK